MFLDNKNFSKRFRGLLYHHNHQFDIRSSIHCNRDSPDNYLTFSGVGKLNILDITQTMEELTIWWFFSFVGIFALIGIVAWLCSRSTLETYKLAQSTSVSYLWDNRFRAGENIVGIISVHSTSGETIDLNKLYPKIILRIKYQNETIATFKNFKYCRINRSFVFHPKKTGRYTMMCSYVALGCFEFTVDKSSDAKLISPGTIDASHTEFLGQRNGEVLTVSVGVKYTLKIEPKDRYKNDCLLADGDGSLFKFECKPLDQIIEPGDRAIEAPSILGWFVSTESDVYLSLHVQVPSLWMGRISYNNQSIAGGLFMIIAIDYQEETELKRILNECTSIRDSSFQVHVETLGMHFYPRYSPIVMTVSPKAVVFKAVDERNGRTDRWAVFRVALRTRLSLKSCSFNYARGQKTKLYQLEITDDIQREVIFWADCSTGRRLLALFFHYRAQCDNVKGFSFETKSATFFQELASQLNPSAITASRRINVLTNDLLRSSWQQVHRYSREEWVELDYVSFGSRFVGGADKNFSVTVWLSSLMELLFTPKGDHDQHLFSKHSGSKFIHPTPVNYRDVTTWPNEYYKLAGLILGKYLVDIAFDKIKTPIFNASLSRSLLAMIIGHPPTYEYVKVDHPEVYKKRFDPVVKSEDVDSLAITFSEEYDLHGYLLKKPVDLFLSGSTVQVKTEHRELYLNCLAKYYMTTTVEDEVHALRTGFYHIIPEELLSNLDVEDLEKLFRFGKKGKPWSWRGLIVEAWNFFFGKKGGNDGKMAGQKGPWEKGCTTKSVPSTFNAILPPSSVRGIEQGRNHSQMFKSYINTNNPGYANHYNNSDTEFQILHKRQNTRAATSENLMEIDD